MATPWKTPLAWLNLVHDRRRLLVSTAGISLAVVLMFMQVGFQNGMYDSQVLLIRKLNADLIMTSEQRDMLHVAESFPRSRLEQALGFAGVAAAYPLYIESTLSLWKNPRDGSLRALRVLAFDPDDPAFDMPAVEKAAAALKLPGAVLFDTRSKGYYGDPRVGDKTELAQHAVEVIGTFELGTDFLTDGNVITGDETFQELFGGRPGQPSRLAEVDLGLIRLQPGVSPRSVQAALRRGLPEDVRVFTRAEFLEQEARFWREKTAIGYVFGLGTTVGFLVGLVICYQILYMNVLGSLPQLATLRAIGYSNRYLIGVVLYQGFYLAVLGFAPALALSQVLYQLVAAATGLWMQLTVWRVASVLLLTVGMCLAASCIATRKVLTVDPAEVFA